MADEKEEPTHLDLFSGIGGFALAAQRAGFRTIGFCEIDKYCQKILAKNFLADPRSVKRQPCSINGERTGTRNAESERSGAIIIGDIRDLDGRDFAGITLITGGFPCQPFSCAGKRRGKEDDRHLWPEMLRVIKEARPAWVLGENVAGIINMELDSVLSGLETIGYACRPFVIPACGVDAKHRRNRVWIVAHTEHAEGARQRQHGRQVLPEQKAARLSRSDSDAAHSVLSGLSKFNGVGNCGSEGSRKFARGELIRTHTGNRGQHWLPEPDVGRVAHGIPATLDISRVTNYILQHGDQRQVEMAKEIAASSKAKKVRTLRLYLEVAAASHGLEKAVSSDNPLSILPYQGRHSQRQMGKRESKETTVCGVQKVVSPEGLSLPCNLREQTMPFDPREVQRWLEVGNRVDRLRGLGNAIVPQVAYEILKVIQQIIG